ncbi:FecCD family ABC transporter permease [Paenibacillus aestuarii]|uniref:Iron ABC transporter permease n=1 Tax=Paenibacillus aestuarii TaxID=516965 RepID=A0ABW0K5F5_9BACL|nr:iron ABC transporter permease [Paenibacillus aestuarii]
MEASKTGRKIPFVYTCIAGCILFIGVVAVSMILGAASTSVHDVWMALTSRSASGNTITMIREIRMPREVAGIFVGAALAVSGAIMQGMTRNPLADPGLLGLTAGANAALACTIAFMPRTNYFGIMVACFIGAALGAALVFGMGAMRKGGFSPLRIVLAGSAVSAFLYAVSEGVGLYFKISKDVTMWTAGGMIGTTWGQVLAIGPVIAAAIVVALLFSKPLTVLSLSEEVATSLGQRTMFVKVVLFIVTILLAGASVALVGNMAFIGLLIPHIVRAVVGIDYRFILPMSAVLGAVFMLLADLLARTLNAPYETPVIAIVAMLGLPFFLFIERKGRSAFT